MSFESAVLDNRRAILALSEPELNLVLPALVDAQEQLAQQLHKIFKQKGQTTFTASKNAQVLKQIDQVIAAAKQKLGGGMIKTLKSQSSSVAKIAVGNLDAMISEGQKKFGEVVAGLQIPIARILVNEKLVLMHRHETSAKRYAGDVGKRLQRLLAIGVVKGSSIDEIAKSMMALSGTPGQKADKASESMIFGKKWEAERLVRTELVHAYNHSQTQALVHQNKEDPGWFLMWDAANDKRTCEQCEFLDGKIAEPGKSFPGGVKHPPLHPCDRCGVVPHRKEWR